MTKQGLCQLQLLADSGSELKGMKIRGTSSVQNKGRSGRRGKGGRKDRGAQAGEWENTQNLTLGTKSTTRVI